MTKQSKKSYFLKIVIALTIVGGGLFWVSKTQGAAIQKVIALLPNFSLTCIALVILLDCLQIFFMSLRFWCLYPKEHRTLIRNVFAAMSIGQSMNAFLPARAGDFYKIASLTPKSAKSDFNMLTLTGILTADKLVDLASFLVLIFAFGSYKESLKSYEGQTIPWKWIIIGMVVLAASWQFFLKKRFGRLALWAIQFLKGLRSLLSPLQLFVTLTIAVLVWLTEALALYELSLYQHFPLTFSQAFFCLTVLNLAIAVPVSVANIGPFEASLAFAMT
ncbi:MAG: lysylphosphatidylglycerol synthase transmembrane domain-containing protein, partial [Deltaproteobacteria bacterium]